MTLFGNLVITCKVRCRRFPLLLTKAGLRCHAFIGGLPIAEDVQHLQHCQIAVATPGKAPLHSSVIPSVANITSEGRLRALIDSGDFTVSQIKLFVLDEADSLLSGSVKEDILCILLPCYYVTLADTLCL